MADAIAEEYKSSLQDLSCNSKPHITMLTMLAEENMTCAPIIVQTIVDHIMKVPPSLKLPCLYLIDSIMKNVGEQYVTLFSRHMISLFSAVFEKVDENTRSLLFKLRQTWTEIMSDKVLYGVDQKVKELDPAWPITAKQPSKRNRVGTQEIDAGNKKKEFSSNTSSTKLEKNTKSNNLKKEILQELIKKQQKLLLEREKVRACLKQKENSDFTNADMFPSGPGSKNMKEDNVQAASLRDISPVNPNVNQKKFSISSTKNLKDHEKMKQESTPILDMQKSVKVNVSLSTTNEVSTTSNRKSNACVSKRDFKNSGKKRKIESSPTKNIGKKCPLNTNIKPSNEMGLFSGSKSQTRDKDQLVYNQVLDDFPPKKYNALPSVTEIDFNIKETNKRPSTDSWRPKNNLCFNEISHLSINELIPADHKEPNENSNRAQNIKTKKPLPAQENVFKESQTKIMENKIVFNVENKEKKLDRKENILKDDYKSDQEQLLDSSAQVNIESSNGKALKRDFKNANTNLEPDNRDDEVKKPRIEDEKETEFRSQNDSILFGDKDQDLRIRSESIDQNPAGWAQYKEAFPEEFVSPKLARESLEGRLRARKFSVESSSSNEDKIKPCFQIERPFMRSSSIELYMRNIQRQTKHVAIDSLCFDPQLYIKKAEESFRRGKVTEDEFLEIRNDLNAMLKSYDYNKSFENNENSLDSKSTAIVSTWKSNHNPPSSLSNLEDQRKDSLSMPVEQSKSLYLDGQMQKLYFIQEKAYIIKDGEPREVSFKKEKKNIFIEGLSEPIILDFDGVPAFFHIHSKKHSIRLGTPTRELYIDDSPYEFLFGGPPLSIKLQDGCNLKISAAGPLPQVVINEQSQNDKLDYFHLKDIDIIPKSESIAEDSNPDESCLALSNEPIAIKDIDMRIKCKNSESSLYDNFAKETHTVMKNIEENKDLQFQSDILLQASSNENSNDIFPHGSKEKAYSQEKNYSRSGESWIDSTNEALYFPDSLENLHHNDCSDKFKRHYPPHWSDSAHQNSFRRTRNDYYRGQHTFRQFQNSNDSYLHPPFHLQSHYQFQDTRNRSSGIYSESTYNNSSLAPRMFQDHHMRRGMRGFNHGNWRPWRFDESYSRGKIVRQRYQQYHNNFPRMSQPSNAFGSVPFPESTASNALYPENTGKKCSSEQEISVSQSSSPAVASIPSVDVDSLMEKLIASGIINFSLEGDKSKSNNKHEEEMDIHEKNAQLSEDIPSIQLIPENLRNYHFGVVSLLHSGTQCESCGIRFKDVKSESYSNHLDWHFRMNRKEKSGIRKAFSKSWFYELEDWLQYEEFGVSNDATPNFFELQAETCQDESDKPLPSVPVSEKEDEECAVCNEPFQLIWVEDEEEWHLRNALRYENEAYHPACFEDFKKEKEANSKAEFSADDNLVLEKNQEIYSKESVDEEIVTIVNNIILQIPISFDVSLNINESSLSDLCIKQELESGEAVSERCIKQELESDDEAVSESQPVSFFEGDFLSVKHELDSSQESEVLEGKPGEEEIIGVITESDVESDCNLPSEDAKMVVLQSGGIVLKVKADRLKQADSSSEILNKGNKTSEKESESEEYFRPPTPDPRFQVLPVVKKGKELSGLCSIM